MEHAVVAALPQAKPAWARSLTQKLTEEHRKLYNRAPTLQWMEKHAKLQFSASDLCESGKPVLPPALLETQYVVVKGPLLLQVEACVDASIPLQRNEFDNDEGRDEGARGSRAGAVRMLRLQVTDGTQHAIAFEYEPIRDLPDHMFVGQKIAIKGVASRRGLLLLRPGSVCLAGGLPLGDGEAVAAGDDRTHGVAAGVNVAAAAAARPPIVAGAGAGAASAGTGAAGPRAVTRSHTAAQGPGSRQSRIGATPQSRPGMTTRVVKHNVGATEAGGPRARGAGAGHSSAPHPGNSHAVGPAPGGRFAPHGSWAQRPNSDGSGPAAPYVAAIESLGSGRSGIKGATRTGPTASSLSRSRPAQRAFPPPTRPLSLHNKSQQSTAVATGAVAVHRPTKRRMANQGSRVWTQAPTSRPFHYMSAIKTRGVSGLFTIKGVVTGVQEFRFRNRPTYYLLVGLEDGSTSTSATLCEGMVTSIMGMPHAEFVKLPKKMKKATVARAQPALGRLEGFMRVTYDAQAGAFSVQGVDDRFGDSAAQAVSWSQSLLAALPREVQSSSRSGAPQVVDLASADDVDDEVILVS